MRKILLGIISLLLIALVGFCEEQSLQLTIKSDKEVYAVGDEIIISGYFKNNSSEKIYLIKDNKPLLWRRLIIANPDGIVFGYSPDLTKETAITPNTEIKYFTFEAVAGKETG
jgi:hypothetical protein